MAGAPGSTPRGRRRARALVAALAVAATACAGAAKIQGPVAAHVNGEVIPEAAIAVEMGLALRNPDLQARFRQPGAAERRAIAQREILTRLVKEKVIAQEARTLGVKVNPNEVQAFVEGLIGTQYQSMEALKEELSKERFTVADMKSFYRRQLLVREVAAAVTKDVKVTDEEIAALYAQAKEQFDSQMRASHILVCGSFDPSTRTCNHSTEDETSAGSIAQRAQGGEDFGALARAYSIDTANNRDGGDLGWFRKGEFAPEFEAALDALQPGQIAGPVRTPYGFHVIKLVARGRSLDDAREDLREALLEPRVEGAFQEWLSKNLRGAEIRVNPKYGRFDRSSDQVVAKAGRMESIVDVGN